jgi:hypothetical protein
MEQLILKVLIILALRIWVTVLLLAEERWTD